MYKKDPPHTGLFATKLTKTFLCELRGSEKIYTPDLPPTRPSSFSDPPHLFWVRTGFASGAVRKANKNRSRNEAEESSAPHGHIPMLFA